MALPRLFALGVCATMIGISMAEDAFAADPIEPLRPDEIEVISWETHSGWFGEKNKLTLWADGRSEVRISRPCMPQPYLVVDGWQEVSKLEFVRRQDASGEGRKRFLSAIAAEPHLLQPAVTHTTDCGGRSVKLSGKGKRWRQSTAWDGSTDNSPANFRRWTALNSIMGDFDDQHPFFILPKTWFVPMSPIELRDASIRASQGR